MEGIRPLHFNHNGEYIMSISKDELVKRKEQIKKDFDSLVEQIKTEEDKIKSMKNLSLIHI